MFASLYISVIIYSYTVCKLLDLAILDMDMKQKKISLSEKLNVICEVEAKSVT
jgi:hypothetical protein